MVQKFFDWFYWFIQIGALLAYTVVVYVQQEVSFFYSYLITVVSMTLATILLLCGRNSYKLGAPEGSYVTDTFRIIGKALQEKFRCKKSLPSVNHWLDTAKITKGGSFPEEKVDPYTIPYTPIHHLMYSTIIIGMFRYIIIIIYEVPTPRSCLGLRQHTSSFNLPGQNSCNMLLNLKLFPVR